MLAVSPSRYWLPGPQRLSGAGGFHAALQRQGPHRLESPAGDNGHWKVVDGVIDYDAESEVAEDKSLYTEREFGDYVLKVEWRIKATPYINPNVPIILSNGCHKKDADGKEIRLNVPDSDSGIYMRGSSKAQVNIWCWPVGSGEVYGYRTDGKMPAGCPRRRDAEAKRRPRHRRVERVRDHDARRPSDRRLNGEEVLGNAQLPGVPARGPDRAAASRRQEGRRLGQPAKPGAVPQHLDQGDVARPACSGCSINPYGIILQAIAIAHFVAAAAGHVLALDHPDRRRPGRGRLHLSSR